MVTTWTYGAVWRPSGTWSDFYYWRRGGRVKVALVIDINRPGGGSLFVPKLYRALEERGHEPVLFSNEDMGLDRYRHVPFYAGTSGPKRLVGAIRASGAMRAAFSELEPDVVVFMSPVAALASTRATRDIPMIYAPRFFVGDNWDLLASSTIPRLVNRTVENRALHRNYDLLVALTEDMKKQFTVRGVPQDLVTVVPIGVCLNRFSPGEKEAGEGDETERRIVVGYAGAFDPVKGIDHLLVAARELLRERDDILFRLAGGDPEELDEEPPEGIEFPGRLSHDEMADFYRECDLVVLPSLTEGLPRVCLEALACGTPVVATDVGGVSEVVIHGETGLLVEPGNSGELRDAIQGMVEAPRKRREMGRRGVRLVREKYDEERNMSRLVDVIEEVPCR